MKEITDIEQIKLNQIWADFDVSMTKHEEARTPPVCHFTYMTYQDGEDESWWECRHCGHAKGIGMLDRPLGLCARINTPPTEEPT